MAMKQLPEEFKDFINLLNKHRFKLLLKNEYSYLAENNK